MTLIPIEGKDGYYRDSKSNAIVNKNTQDYNTYLMNRQKLLSDKQRIDDLENEMTQIKGDLGDIKMMLQYFMEQHK